MPPLRVANLTLGLLTVLIWSSFSASGLSMMQEARIAGRPFESHMSYYVDFPVLMLVSALVACGLALFTRLRIVALIAQVTLLIVAFPFLLAYTGGV
jgi:glucan phosphoethanolaminetransferase (alkaline phosphatase superfamily)